MRKKAIRPNATWRVEKIQGRHGSLVRLIAPLAVQKGKEKTMCLAIGSKRMRDLLPILNSLNIKV